MYQSVCLSICLYNLFIYLSVCLPNLSIYISMFLSAYISILRSDYLCLSIYPCIHVYLSVHPSLCYIHINSWMDGWMDGWTDRQLMCVCVCVYTYTRARAHTHPQNYPSIHPSIRKYTSLSVCISLPFHNYLRLSVFLYTSARVLPNNKLWSCDNS